MRFLVENKEWNPSVFDCPILIHGVDGSGASYFSINLISSFFLNGAKILFFTLKPDARDLFDEQISEKKEETIFVSEENGLGNIGSAQGIIIKSGDTELCKKVLRKLPGKNRIIFIKNAEDLLDQELFDLVKESPQYVISGDFSKSEFLRGVASLEYPTRILFSPLGFEQLSDLPQHQGYIVARNCQGTIRTVE